MLFKNRSLFQVSKVSKNCDWCYLKRSLLEFNFVIVQDSIFFFHNEKKILKIKKVKQLNKWIKVLELDQPAWGKSR